MVAANSACGCGASTANVIVEAVMTATATATATTATAQNLSVVAQVVQECSFHAAFYCVNAASALKHGCGGGCCATNAMP